jgi:hypothetical protein
MKRLMHATVHEARLQVRNIAVAALAVAGALTLASLLGWVGEVEVPDLWTPYQLAIVVLGVLITSSSFAEMRSPGRRIEFLLRPATVWEKVISKLLVTTILVWVVTTAAFVLAAFSAWLLYVIVAGTADAGAALSPAFADGRWLTIAWETLLGYLPLHAIFFFGSVYFKKHPAGRTLLAVVVWIGSYLIVGAGAIRVIFARYLGGAGFEMREQLWREIAPWFVRNPEAAETLFSVAVPAVFWLLTVLRLRESEA